MKTGWDGHPETKEEARTDSFLLLHLLQGDDLYHTNSTAISLQDLTITDLTRRRMLPDEARCIRSIPAIPNTLHFLTKLRLIFMAPQMPI